MTTEIKLTHNQWLARQAINIYFNDYADFLMRCTSNEVLLFALRNLGINDRYVTEFATQYGDAYYEYEQTGADLLELAHWIAVRISDEAPYAV